MKKSYLLVLGVFLTAFLFFLSPSASYADLYQLDQRQLEGTGCVTAYSGNNHNQTFIDTYNVLTKVGVKMRHMNGGNVTLTVKDEVTGQVVVSMTQRMGVDEGWIYFDLVDDALGYIIDPEHTHSLWIGTAYYQTPAPCWIYTSTDEYSYGVRRQGLVERTGDLTFTTYGYTLDMGRENPDPPPAEDPPAEDPPAEDPPVEDPPAEDPQDETDGTLGETPDQSEDATDVIVEEDSSVTSPTLESVIKNDIVVDLTGEEEEVEVVEGDMVKVIGTADPGDEVAVIVGDKAYTATADEDGNWYVLFSIIDFEDGEYTVEAQSQDEDGKGSEKVEMFVLSKNTVSKVVNNTVEEAEEESEKTSLWDRLYTGDLRYVTLIALLLLVCGLFWLLIIIRRKKEEKKKGEIEKKEVKIEKEIK